MYQFKLSICIPTYNRNSYVNDLVRSIIDTDFDVEVCVYVDGATDRTYENLRSLDDSRISLGFSENRGRASALYSAVNMARGKYVMIYDDDDFLDPNGIRQILADLDQPLPDKCVGYIYHMENDMGCQIGSDFPVYQSNFLALRADHDVTGDKKEVVLAEALKSVMELPQQRRVPTSLYWSRLAIKYDVICRNVCVGKKKYLDGGMTSRIWVLKIKSPRPLVVLYRSHIKGYFDSRYESRRYFVRAVFGWVFYYLINKVEFIFKFSRNN